MSKVTEFKGCKLLINIDAVDVTALGSGSTIKLEMKGYTSPDFSDEPTTKTIEYAQIFKAKELTTKNEFVWTFMLEAELEKDTDLGHHDIDFGQRWSLSDNEVYTDDKAPKRGFRVNNDFDKMKLTLNSMTWQDTVIELGEHGKGTFDVTPEIPFRVTIMGNWGNCIYEFPFKPKDPENNKSPFTQTLTFRPAKWSSG